MTPAIDKVLLTDVAARAVELAVKAGATGAECTIEEGNEFSAAVRMGEVESVKEAGSRGAGIRVLLGKKSGSAYTSDLTDEGIAAMVHQAVEIAAITSEDPYAGLPEDYEFGCLEGDLQLFHPDVEALSTEIKIDQAKRAEAAALSFDPRINNSEGASFDSYTAQRVFVNSSGFVNSYRRSSCSLSTVPVARQGDGPNSAMERDFWSTSSRSAAKLESPEYVGRTAAARVLRRLGARKVATQRAPVIFESRVARGLLDHLFDAVNGGAIYRKASFLTGKLGEKIAADNVTIVDDATMPGLFGTGPCDDEGVPSRRTVVVENGILRNYLLNTYAARRLSMKTTGNASRGLTGAPGIGHGNFYLEPGARTLEEMIRDMGRGLLVTELIGFGVNTVTGDYSRGAVGLWIENGAIAHPVSEVTIASTLQEMFAGIAAIGSELEFRGSLASPPVMIREMTISGQGN